MRRSESVIVAEVETREAARRLAAACCACPGFSFTWSSPGLRAPEHGVRPATYSVQARRDGGGYLTNDDKVRARWFANGAAAALAWVDNGERVGTVHDHN